MSKSEAEFRLKKTGDKTPAQLAELVRKQVERGQRMILKKTDPKRASRSFRRARMKNVKMLPLIMDEYDLNKDEIKRAVGRDMEHINDTMMDLISEMAIADIEMKKTGECQVSENTLMEIEEITVDLKNFEDLLKGIENDTIEVERQ